MRKINIWILVLILLAAPALVSAQVNFSVDSDRSAASAGEKFSVVATLVTPHAVQGTPHVAANDAFDVVNVNTSQSQSHNIQMINGKIEQSRTIVYRYIYTIMPKAGGAFTFPALKVSIDGREYSTRPLNFNAGGSGGSGIAGGGSTGGGSGAIGGGGGAIGGGSVSTGGNTGGGSHHADAQHSSDIRASLNISKKTLYPGEQAVLTLKVAQRAGSPIQTQRGYNPAVEQIEKAFAKGLSANRLFTSQITQGQERIDGADYITFSLQYAVFGLTAGEYSIPGITFEYDEIQMSQRRRVNPFFSDFFDMDFFGGGREAVRRTTRTAPFTITVKPLPPNAPAGFGGSVGRLSLSASAEPLSIPAGEAFTLRVTLRGNTRASNIGDPVIPDLKECDVFTPERQTAVDTGANGFTTRKTYRYLIIPKQAGALTIPSITYPFLDPETGAYRTARSEPVTITVTPGKGGPKEQTRYLTQDEIRQVGQDIRYIKTPEKIKHQPLRPYRAPYWYLLFPMPFLIFLFVLIYRMQSNRSGESQSKNIRQKALSTALKELNKAGKAGTDNEFLGKAAAVIEKYISHKFAFPATGRTLEELKDELLKMKIDEQTVTGLTVLIESINEHRFGGKIFNSQGRSEMVDSTIKFLSTMEKSAQRGKSSASPVSSVVLALAAMAMMFPAVLSAEEASPDNIAKWFQAANQFYVGGAYDSAQVYYTKITDAGITNSVVLFNLGNTYYRLSKPGLARLHYEKAAVLDPADADIRTNINFIKSVIVDRLADEGEPDFMTAVLHNIHTLLPLNTQLIIVCALLFALALFGSLMLMRRGLARLWLAYGAVLCVLLIAVVGSSAGYKIYTIESRQYAIVLIPSLDAKNQPQGAQTLFTAHEGTKLRVSKTAGDWSLVSLPNGSGGWVVTASLGKI
ncbi:MAG: BatD family protein [Chitinispirillia bacterium]|nr:BatD family protein [Chitinispirillia bacterium]MCL2241406.1 BatD family protein [Chitinispirillia bacterium]